MLKLTFNKMYIFSWLMYLTGMLVRFLHYPGDQVLLLSGIVVMFIHAGVNAGLNFKKDSTDALIYFNIALLTVYLEARMQFWTIAKPVFYITMLMLLFQAAMQLRVKRAFKKLQLFQVLYVGFVVLISFVPSYKIYYLIRLNGLLNSETRRYDYLSWDTYSWYLYLRHKQEDALDANRNAGEALVEYGKMMPGADLTGYAQLIQQHQFQIEHENWVEYP